MYISSPVQVEIPSPTATKLVTPVLHRPAAQVRDSVRHVDAKLVELSNGCICCTLRDDLLTSVADIVAAQRFDYLVIESTGGLTAYECDCHCMQCSTSQLCSTHSECLA